MKMAASTGYRPNEDDADENLGQGAVCRLENFPLKLYRMLQDVHRLGLTSVISWADDGRSFLVHKPKVFEQSLMRTYFKHTKYKSFQRQLNLYQFTRTPRFKVQGVYSHPLFRRGEEALCRDIKRPTTRPRGGSLNDSRHRSNNILLSDIVPLENSPAPEINPGRLNQRLDLCKVPSYSNLKSSSVVHSITNEDLTETARIRSSSRSRMEAYGTSNAPFDLHRRNGMTHSISQEDLTSTAETTSKRREGHHNHFVCVPRVQLEFGRNIGFRTLTPSPLLLEADDDDWSMGTIDSLSNIQNIVG